jgi:hypothetical protein
MRPVAGAAVFQGLHITAAAAAVRVCARLRLPRPAAPPSASLSGCSDAFDVVAAQAESLLIVDGPSPVARAGERMPPIAVRVVDAYGNGGAAGTLGMSVLADVEPLTSTEGGPPAAEVEAAGMTALPDIDGLARFDRMIITTPGRFALRFSLGSLPPITSSPFIVRSRASSLVFTEPPPAYAEAGRAFRVAVELRDASGGVAEAEAGTVRIGSHGWDFSVGGTTQARCPPVTSGCGLGAAARAHMPPRQVVVVDGVAVFEAVLLHMATDSTHHAYVLPSTIQLQSFFDRRAAALILALRLPRPCPVLSHPLTRPPHTGAGACAHGCMRTAARLLQKRFLRWPSRAERAVRRAVRRAGRAALRDAAAAVGARGRATRARADAEGARCVWQHGVGTDRRRRPSATGGPGRADGAAAELRGRQRGRGCALRYRGA